jgi:hypothetical protein
VRGKRPVAHSLLDIGEPRTVSQAIQLSRFFLHLLRNPTGNSFHVKRKQDGFIVLEINGVATGGGGAWA